MLISHKNRFVFLHNPKVAGTSVRNMLASHFECEDYRAGARVDGLMQDQAHLRVDQWPQWLWNLYMQGYYFFGFVRDPRDRFMSSMSEFTYQNSDVYESLKVSREEFLIQMLTPDAITYDMRFIHFTEQWRFFDYAPATTPGIHLDISVFKFEDLATVLKDPTFLRGVGSEQPLEIKNERPSFHRNEIAGSYLENMIPFLYRDDYRLFGYQPKQEVSFLPQSHAHRLEFVHRFPEMIPEGALNALEEAAMARPKPQMESASMYMLRAYAMEANRLRMNAKETPNV